MNVATITFLNTFRDIVYVPKHCNDIIIKVNEVLREDCDRAECLKRLSVNELTECIGTMHSVVGKLNEFVNGEIVNMLDELKDPEFVKTMMDYPTIKFCGNKPLYDTALVYTAALDRVLIGHIAVCTIVRVLLVDSNHFDSVSDVVQNITKQMRNLPIGNNPNDPLVTNSLVVNIKNVLT